MCVKNLGFNYWTIIWWFYVMIYMSMLHIDRENIFNIVMLISNYILEQLIKSDGGWSVKWSAVHKWRVSAV